MFADQVQVIEPDEYRRAIHRLIDRVLDTSDQNERYRWAIVACRDMGMPELLDAGIVDDVLQCRISERIDAILIGEEASYTNRELRVAVCEASERGMAGDAIADVVAVYTDGPGRSMTTIKSERRGEFLDAIRAL